MFFPKLFKWFKEYGELLAIISAIVLVAIAGIQSCRVSKLVKEHHELKGKLTEQKKDQDKLYADAEVARIKRDTERAVEKSERARLEASIKKARDEGLAAKRALEKEKEKTAKLQPTELVAQIVERIGFESNLTKSGLYLFTRKGAERTLDRFKDGEFYLTEYNRLGKALEDHDLEIASFNTSIEECEKTGATNLKGWDDCRETLATAMKDIDTLEKIKKSGVWRGRVQGGIGAVVIAAGLKLLGVW